MRTDPGLRWLCLGGALAVPVVTATIAVLIAIDSCRTSPERAYGIVVPLSIGYMAVFGGCVVSLHLRSRTSAKWRVLATWALICNAIGGVALSVSRIAAVFWGR